MFLMSTMVNTLR